MEESNIQPREPQETDTETVRPPVENIMASHHSHMGMVLGTLIILLILVMVGLYLWGGELSENQTQGTAPTSEQPFNNNEPETPRAAADAQIFETLSPSDEITSIEADLESTNFDSLGSELDTVERELGTALGE